MRVLVVEDERKIASFIKRGLKEKHYAVDVVHDGFKALEMVELNPYDLFILDIMIPGKDGLEICREIREKKIDTPIILLTARSKVKDKVEGLHAGADDYLAKPFDFQELLARVEALLRRSQQSFSSTTLQIDDLELNTATQEVKRSGETVNLTAKEFSLLRYLMMNKGQVITRTMISEHVWNEDFDSFTNVIDVYVNYLRKKIDKGSDKALIRTVRGMGYVLGDKND